MKRDEIVTGRAEPVHEHDERTVSAAVPIDAAREDDVEPRDVRPFHGAGTVNIELLASAGLHAR